MRPPLDGNPTITSWPWSIQADGTPHGGYDFACPIGTPVYACEGFTIDFSGWEAGYGIAGNGEHGRWRYWHLSKLLRGNGFVAEGQIIGLSGNSGVSSGPHLHCDCMKNGTYFDYMKYMEENMATVQELTNLLHEMGNLSKAALAEMGHTIDPTSPDTDAVKIMRDYALKYFHSATDQFEPIGQLYVKKG